MLLLFVLVGHAYYNHILLFNILLFIFFFMQMILLRNLYFILLNLILFLSLFFFFDLLHLCISESYILRTSFFTNSDKLRGCHLLSLRPNSHFRKSFSSFSDNFVFKRYLSLYIILIFFFFFLLYLFLFIILKICISLLKNFLLYDLFLMSIFFNFLLIL